MSVLLIDPHGDDVALFCAYTALRERHDVLLTHRTVPMDEVKWALPGLGTLNIYESIGDWGEDVRKVYAPAPHPEGHDEHNEAARIAMTFIDAEVIGYCTYAPRAVRQMGVLVEPDPWMVARKLRALGCFVSQIEQESTRPWFTSLLDVREWLT